MKEKPIIFCTDMVKAILADRKTMTRRIIKTQPSEGSQFLGFCSSSTEKNNEGCAGFGIDSYVRHFIKPPYEQDDILWVRETWGNHSWDNPESWAIYWVYRADYPIGAKSFKAIDDGEEIECDFPKWRPSIFMPREAARIFLRVTNVRAERLQDITDEDARKEGCPKCLGASTCGGCDGACEHMHPVLWFKNLWKSINEKRGYGWDANPWVWVIEFERAV